MSRIFASKTKSAFYQTISAAIAALMAIFFVFFKVYQLFSLYLVVLMHKIIDACGCADMAQFFSMHPDIFKAAIFLGIVIGIFILHSLYKLATLISRTKKYIAHYLSFADGRHSAKLEAAIKALGLDGAKIVEINRSDLAVFCFGFWRPKICISRALIGILDENELRAVLLHEAQHMISYEPLKVFAVKYFHDIFFFLPGFKNSAKKYITLSELAADEKASGNSMSRSCLASAILKISAQQEYRRLKSGSPSPFFSPAIEERANRLSDQAYVPEFNFWDRGLIIGSLGLAVVSLFILFVFSDSTKAFEMHSGDACILADSPKSDLACSLAGRQRISNVNSDIFHNMSGAGFRQNSVCAAE